MFKWRIGGVVAVAAVLVAGCGGSPSGRQAQPPEPPPPCNATVWRDGGPYQLLRQGPDPRLTPGARIVVDTAADPTQGTTRVWLRVGNRVELLDRPQDSRKVHAAICRNSTDATARAASTRRRSHTPRSAPRWSLERTLPNQEVQ